MKTKGTPQYYQSRTISADFACLKTVGGYVRQACQAAGFDSAVTYSIELAVDEAFSNIIEHAYHHNPGEYEIECTCAVDQYALYIELHDHGTPFNPAEIPAPELTAEVALRSKGGLGLYFMRRLMDVVDFQFVPDEQKLDPSATGNFLLLVKFRDQKA